MHTLLPVHSVKVKLLEILIIRNFDWALKHAVSKLNEESNRFRCMKLYQKFVKASTASVWLNQASETHDDKKQISLQHQYFQTFPTNWNRNKRVYPFFTIQKLHKTTGIFTELQHRVEWCLCKNTIFLHETLTWDRKLPKIINICIIIWWVVRHFWITKFDFFID